MESKRFDNWTRNRALRLSRRDALRLAGAGGAATALAAIAPDALAQSPCSFTIHGETSGGPSAPASYDGTLQFSLGSDGIFTQATFTPTGGGAQPATGRVTGRAIDFEVTLSGNQTLAFSGATDQSTTTCQGEAAGILTGPEPGDLGGWQATGVGSQGGSNSSGSTTGSGSSGSAGQSSLSCPPPQTACGSNCCPSGATCTNANQGLCACASGTEQCGTNCVPSCDDGQSLDLDSCTCPNAEAACIANQQTCANHDDCCSGYCGGGTCFDCAFEVCGAFGCVDTNQDTRHCGACFNPCPVNQACVGGVCGCAPDESPCINHEDCCSLLCGYFGPGSNCDPCPTDIGYTLCAPGICVLLTAKLGSGSDNRHCGACFNACPPGTNCSEGTCI